MGAEGCPNGADIDRDLGDAVEGDAIDSERRTGRRGHVSRYVTSAGAGCAASRIAHEANWIVVEFCSADRCSG